MSRRYELSDEQWEKIEFLLPGRSVSVGVTADDNRKFVNGVMWVLRSGAPWRDLPERYGDWNNVHKRFARWAKSGVWEKVFAYLTVDSDNEYLSIDSTIVKAHQHSAGAKGSKKKTNA